MTRNFVKLIVFLVLLFSSSSTFAFYHCNLFWKYQWDDTTVWVINVTNINYIRVASVTNIDNLYRYSVPSDLVDNGTDLECATADCYASPATLSAGAMIYDDVAYAHTLYRYPADDGTLRQRILDKISDDGLTCSAAMEEIIEDDLDSGAVSGIDPDDWDDYVLCFTRAMDFPDFPASVRLEWEIHWVLQWWWNEWDIAVSVTCDVAGENESWGGGWGWRPSVPTCTDEQLECTRYDPRVAYRWSRKPGEVCIGGKFGDECSIEIPDEPEEETPPEPEDLTYLEDPLKGIYDDYLDKKRDLEEIETGEATSWAGLKVYPETLLKTGTPITDRTYIQRTSTVETALPENSYEYAGWYNDDIDFRTQKLVEEDRDRGLYIVIPSNGLVMPINEVPDYSEEYTQLVSGQTPDVNEYLKTGALLYPGTSRNGFGEIGNKVIFWHSSYWKHDDGRYKTEFQKIIEMDEEEEIWIYEKNSDGEYERYRYKVRITYPIEADNTYPLQPSIGKNLTLVTCTPVGWITGRRVVSAKFIDEEKEGLETYLYGDDLSFEYKAKIQKFINKLNQYDEEEKKELILKLYKALLKFENTKAGEKFVTAISYLKLKIAIAFYEG